jgi:hypothetical protein
VLAACGARHDRQAQRTAEKILARFADSPTCADLAAARACRRGVEFLLDGPAVRGVIDCLWEDAAGGRHLLCFARPSQTEPPLPLVLAAAALHRQTGDWPRTATLYDLASGAVVRRVGDSLPHDRVVAEVAAAVNDLCGREL